MSLGALATLWITSSDLTADDSRIEIGTCGLEAVDLRFSTFIESYNAGRIHAAASHFVERPRLVWPSGANADEEDSQPTALDSQIRIRYEAGVRIQDHAILDVGFRSRNGEVLFTGSAISNRSEVSVTGRYDCVSGRFAALLFADPAIRSVRAALQQGQ